MVLCVQISTNISLQTLFIEDASLQHLDQDFFFIFTPLTRTSNTISTNIYKIR